MSIQVIRYSDALLPDYLNAAFQNAIMLQKIENLSHLETFAKW